MKTIYLDKLTRDLQVILARTFPDYTGRTFRVNIGKPYKVSSYWDGGSRSQYVFYDLDRGAVWQVPTNHPFFQPEAEAASDKALEIAKTLPRVIVVEHSIFCGKDAGIIFWADAGALTPMLPETPQTEPDERTVLQFTASLRSSYGGIKNLRYVEAHRKTGITLDRWDAAKAACVAKRFLTKAGAITPTGRNAVA